MSTRRILTELEPDALAEALAGLGARPFHARQIYRWLYRRGVADFARMTDLSMDLRAKLERTFAIPTPAVTTRSESADGTVKFLLRLGDGREVESVFIPDTPAMTFCVSTQVGCAMRCGFCLTGRMGLLRNLTAGEIAAQVRVMAHDLDSRQPALQHRADGHGRAAAQLRRDDEGAADPGRRVRTRRCIPPPA